MIIDIHFFYVRWPFLAYTPRYRCLTLPRSLILRYYITPQNNNPGTLFPHWHLRKHSPIWILNSKHCVFSGTRVYIRLTCTFINQFTMPCPYVEAYPCRLLEACPLRSWSGWETQDGGFAWLLGRDWSWRGPSCPFYNLAPIPRALLCARMYLRRGRMINLIYCRLIMTDDKSPLELRLIIIRGLIVR